MMSTQPRFVRSEFFHVVTQCQPRPSLLTRKDYRAFLGLVALTVER